MSEIISPSEAKGRGLARYFTGRPCKRGHVAARYVTSHNCCQCRDEWQVSDIQREKRRKYDAAYYKKRCSTPEGLAKLKEETRRAMAKYLTDPAIRERRRHAHKTPAGRLRARRTKLRQYGLTIDQYDDLLRAQNFGCAVCSVKKHLHVDHNHSTGKIRALLCHRCNLAIGLFGDDPIRMEKAAAYLRRFAR